MTSFAPKTDEEKRADFVRQQAAEHRKRELDRRAAIEKAQKDAEKGLHRPLVTST